MRDPMMMIAAGIMLMVSHTAMAEIPRHAGSGPAPSPSLIMQDPYATPRHFEDRKAQEQDKLSMCNQLAGMEALRADGHITGSTPQAMPSPQDCARLKRDIEARTTPTSSAVPETLPESAAQPVR